MNGYGAGRVLGWLVSGRLLDDGRLPVVSILAAVGLVVALVRWRTDAGGRALVVVLVGCFLLSSGRTTFGSLVDVIPGSGDLFFRRFMMGIQLAALLLAGLGAGWVLSKLGEALGRGPAWLRSMSSRRVVRGAFACVAGILVLAPAWTELSTFDDRNASAIDAQRLADASQGVQLDRLIAEIDRDGGGRVYAGMPSNWGMDFTVGAVPVFKYLESRDVDEVGYTLRTASLMTDPEYYFDDDNVSDYDLFGIRYLLLPSGWVPPVPSHLLKRAGPYALWTVGRRGYVDVGRIVGVTTADRTDVGARSIDLLRSGLAARGAYLRVDFGAASRSAPLPAVARNVSTGSVIAESDDLEQGVVDTTVRMKRPGVVVLSVSFDPGWTATVDGRAHATEMVAPALVATRVSAGTHRIVFRYRGFDGYLELFVLSGVCLVAVLAADLGPVLRSVSGAAK